LSKHGPSMVQADLRSLNVLRSLRLWVLKQEFPGCPLNMKIKWLYNFTFHYLIDHFLTTGLTRFNPGITCLRALKGLNLNRGCLKSLKILLHREDAKAQIVENQYCRFSRLGVLAVKEGFWDTLFNLSAWPSALKGLNMFDIQPFQGWDVNFCSCRRFHPRLFILSRFAAEFLQCIKVIIPE
jgi:hypothetical protein